MRDVLSYQSCASFQKLATKSAFWFLAKSLRVQSEKIVRLHFCLAFSSFFWYVSFLHSKIYHYDACVIHYIHVGFFLQETSTLGRLMFQIHSVLSVSITLKKIIMKINMSWWVYIIHFCNKLCVARIAEDQ